MVGDVVVVVELVVGVGMVVVVATAAIPQSTRPMYKSPMAVGPSMWRCAA